MKRITLSLLVLFLSSACTNLRENKEMPPSNSQQEKKQEEEAIARLDEKAKQEAAGEMKSAEKPPVVKKPLWSYSGMTGPSQWGDLSPEFAKCATGQRQSPIDLVWQKPVRGNEVGFNYKAQRIQLLDDGHAVKVIFPAGSKINFSGQQYLLKHAHFHSRSEHSISGTSFPMEMHLVHQSPEGELAVIGVLFRVGKENEVLNALWKNVSLKKNQLTEVPGVLFNPIGLLPKVRTRYHYVGSLTTPPCTEGVKWLVYNTAIEISQGQLEKFRQYYGANYRPTQPRNGRPLTNH